MFIIYSKTLAGFRQMPVIKEVVKIHTEVMLIEGSLIGAYLHLEVNRHTLKEEHENY